MFDDDDINTGRDWDPPEYEEPKFESFFYIFDYSFMTHDACGQHNLTYEVCTITKNLDLPSGSLKIGEHYEYVYFNFVKEHFMFANFIWDENKPELEFDWNRSVKIPQKELAPYLVW